VNGGQVVAVDVHLRSRTKKLSPRVGGELAYSACKLLAAWIDRERGVGSRHASSPRRIRRTDVQPMLTATFRNQGGGTIVADVPEHIHKQIRMPCLERSILVRGYTMELLSRDGIR
jgi:hypothetical protein